MSGTLRKYYCYFFSSTCNNNKIRFNKFDKKKISARKFKNDRIFKLLSHLFTNENNYCFVIFARTPEILTQCHRKYLWGGGKRFRIILNKMGKINVLLITI